MADFGSVQKYQGSSPGNYLNTNLLATGVTPGTYGDATHVSRVTVDATGLVTDASSVAITTSGAIPSIYYYINSEVQVLTDSVATAIKFPNLSGSGSASTDTTYNSGTGAITFTRTGFYQFSLNLTGTGPAGIVVTSYINNVAAQECFGQYNSTNATMRMTWTASVNIGDIYSVKGLVAGGGFQVQKLLADFIGLSIIRLG